MKTEVILEADGSYTIKHAPLLIAETLELLVKKTQDYNADKDLTNFKIDDPRDEYFPLGAASYIQMIWTKVMRIKNVAAKIAQGGTPHFDGLEDSLKDIVAYSCFFYSYLDQKTKEKKAKEEQNKTYFVSSNNVNDFNIPLSNSFTNFVGGVR